MKRCRLRLKARERHQDRMRLIARRSSVMIATGRELRNQNCVWNVPTVLSGALKGAWISLKAGRKTFGWKR